MTAPLISVIIPAYDCARFLREAIESSLQQTHPCVEVIVINDGSPDNTDDVVWPYLDRITYHKQENRGLSGARNVGFRASHGEFICFLDADDVLMPEKFEQQLAIFKREPDLGVVISGYTDVEEDGRTEIQTVRKSWYRDALKRLLNHEVFPPHTALIRRSVLEASPLFPENIDTAESQEDWQLWLELALSGVQFGSVPEPTCKYRQRAGSIRTNPLKHLDGARRVVRWLRAFPKARRYGVQVERLAAIVEMERVAAAYRVGLADLVAENLASAVRQFPAFWQDPHTLLRLFERTFTVQEIAARQGCSNTSWFERRIIHDILPQGRHRLTELQFKRLLAAAYLALSDLAYGVGDHKSRRRALQQAVQLSLVVCASPAGWASAGRGFLGPSLGARLTHGLRLAGVITR